MKRSLEDVLGNAMCEGAHGTRGVCVHGRGRVRRVRRGRCMRRGRRGYGVSDPRYLGTV